MFKYLQLLEFINSISCSKERKVNSLLQAAVLTNQLAALEKDLLEATEGS